MRLTNNRVCKSIYLIRKQSHALLNKDSIYFWRHRCLTQINIADIFTCIETYGLSAQSLLSIYYVYVSSKISVDLKMSDFTGCHLNKIKSALLDSNCKMAPATAQYVVIWLYHISHFFVKRQRNASVFSHALCIFIKSCNIVPLYPHQSFQYTSFVRHTYRSSQIVFILFLISSFKQEHFNLNVALEHSRSTIYFIIIWKRCFHIPLNIPIRGETNVTS